jgi:hypothetical protein
VAFGFEDGLVAVVIGEFDLDGAVVEQFGGAVAGYFVLARRVAAAGGRDPTRVGLEKTETLAVGLRGALAKRLANLASAVVRLTSKGRLSFAPEPPRKGAKR